MSEELPWEGASSPIPIGGIQVLVVSLVFEVFAIIAVILRLWSRQIMKTTLAFNDYAVLVGLFFTTGLVIDLVLNNIAVYLGGEGRSGKYLGRKQLEAWSKLFCIAQILWPAGNCGVKLSILHLYITIFLGRTFKILCYIFMTLSVGYMLMTFLVDFLICTPVARNWDPFIPGHCGNQRMAYFFTAIINLLIDVGIVILPIPLVWRLQMPVARRIGVIAMFGLGAFICILTLIRVKAIWDFDLNIASFKVVPVAIWSVLEPTLGVVNACLPVMRPALHKLFGLHSMIRTRLPSRRSEPKSSKNSKCFDRSNKEGNVSKKKLDNDFQRLYDDQYALEEQMHTTQAERAKKTFREDDMQQSTNESRIMGSIKVTNTWDVRSVERGTRDIV